MSFATRKPTFSRLAAASIAAAGLCALAVPLAPAQAQVPYLGVDFGNGFRGRDFNRGHLRFGLLGRIVLFLRAQTGSEAEQHCGNHSQSKRLPNDLAR